mmetsp:Transcript_58200/g.159732  ORF Transcript_58200/g.159732 Transcript_58200/m.159732 type:complete len:251 (+) Transcript_58200:910-1662(+)
MNMPPCTSTSTTSPEAVSGRTTSTGAPATAPSICSTSTSAGRRYTPSISESRFCRTCAREPASCICDDSSSRTVTTLCSMGAAGLEGPLGAAVRGRSGRRGGTAMLPVVDAESGRLRPTAAVALAGRCGRTTPSWTTSGRLATRWLSSQRSRSCQSERKRFVSYVGRLICSRFTSFRFCAAISSCCRCRKPMLSDVGSTAAPNSVVFCGTQWSITGTWLPVSRTPPPHSRVLCVGLCDRSRILLSLPSSR